MQSAKSLSARIAGTAVRNAREVGRNVHSCLLDVIFFLEIVLPTKNLDIGSVFGRSPKRVRNDVVEMEILPRTALNAATLIPLPDF